MAAANSLRASASRSGLLAPGLRRQMMTAASGISDLIGLGRGDPDIDTPRHIVDAMQRALDAGQTHYTAWNGIPELRIAIARKLMQENGVRVDPQTEVLVTGGAQEAVFIAAQVLLDPGDEALIADPHYSSYDTAIGLAGGVLVPVPTVEAESFDLQVDALERACTPRSKVLLLVNPSNPAGSVLTREALVAIAEFAARHDLTVVADEIYEKYLYDEARHVSMASLDGIRDRTITINSFSKSYAMTGWRLGYMAGPASFIAAAGELKYALSICEPPATQLAAVAALEGPQDHIPKVVAEYDARRKLLLAGLSGMGLNCARPRGGFTVLANVKQTGLDSIAFCLLVLREAHVQIFPGVMYGPAGEGYARISFLVPQPKLAEAIERVRGVVRTLVA